MFIPGIKPSFAKISGGGFRAHARYEAIVAHWPMVEGGAKTLYEIANLTNGGNGTIANGTWTGGLFGPAISFNATTSDIDCGNPTAFKGITPLSVSAWIYPKSSGQTITGNYGGVIVAKGRTTEGWQLKLSTANGGIQLEFTAIHATTTVDVRSAASTVTQSGWSHVAVTAILANPTLAANVHLYINGVEPAYAAQNNGSGNYTGDTLVNLHIGNNNLQDQTFDGYIEEVRVYSRVLAPTDVNSLYNDPFLEFRLPKIYSFPLSAAVVGFPPQGDNTSRRSSRGFGR